ncbi:hypothetical protein J6590_053807 [Homalodisca vitripennis]|nr:hypothetical protein J6590_053807 [Homalodisca vitripennis]
MDKPKDYLRLNFTIGIDEDLKMILDMDPGLIDPLPTPRPPHPLSPADNYLSWSPVPPTSERLAVQEVLQVVSSITSKSQF